MKKLILFVLPLILFSCSGLKVVSDLDPTVDFTKYTKLEYYGWAENSDKILNRFDKERIENAFGEEFRKRGVEVVESGGDIVVSLYIITEQKTAKSATTNHMGGYGGYYGYGPGYRWGGGHSTTTYHEYDYTVGTLVVSVFDAEKKELVWEAVGEGTIDENPQAREKSTPRAVAQIMSKYPVAPKE